MLQVITAATAHRHSSDVAEMHRLRYRVFKERLNWDVHTENGLEFDEFDALQPTYLIAFDHLRRVVGSWRVLPTTGSYMLRDVFPQLLNGAPPPRDPGIWETSRFAVDCMEDSEAGLGALSTVTSELFCGLVELCLANGISEIVTVYDVRIARLLNRVGCKPYWVSPRMRLGNTIAVAGRFEISNQVLADIRMKAGFSQPILSDAIPTRFFEAA